jgi:hypothetical protein
VARRATICLAIAVVGTAGCGGGGTLSKKDLKLQAEAVQSLAAEGALVAKGVEQGRTTDTFVRVHTDYMAKAVRKVETELSSKRASGSLDQKREEALKLASLVSLNLDRLHRHPGDKALAAQLSSELEDKADAAEKLAK